MNTHFIAAPYDSGRYNWRLGAGPLHWLRSGIADELRARGHTVAQTEIVLPADGKAEIAAAFSLAQEIAREVRTAYRNQEVPIVLAGNCASSWGTVAALRERNPAVIWFDAHADLNTPDTTRSGFLDGMSLAVLTGRCWAEMAGSIEGFEPMDDRNIVLAGARELDAPERALIERSDLAVAAQLPALRSKLERLRSRCDIAYVHLDLDVVDADEGCANQFAARGGWPGADVVAALSLIREYLPIGAINITAYDPTADVDRAIERVMFNVMRVIPELFAGPALEP